LFAILLSVVVVALGVLAAPPARADAADEHWIEVNLSTLRARAWDGDTVVYVAPVTAGRPGWETPTGTFYVLRRVYDATMDSATLGIPHNQPGGWKLKHVYFTQYFTDYGHSIHYNYWIPSSYFGRVRSSHGCVGMRYADARFFWRFGDVGTRIWIHY
jgi:lipoprotein-anchoring transpeptidase ErfK/SrfK